MGSCVGGAGSGFDIDGRGKDVEAIEGPGVGGEGEGDEFVVAMDEAEEAFDGGLVGRVLPGRGLISNGGVPIDAGDEEDAQQGMVFGEESGIAGALGVSAHGHGGEVEVGSGGEELVPVFGGVIGVEVVEEFDEAVLDGFGAGDVDQVGGVGSGHNLTADIFMAVQIEPQPAIVPVDGEGVGIHEGDGVVTEFGGGAKDVGVGEGDGWRGAGEEDEEFVSRGALRREDGVAVVGVGDGGVGFGGEDGANGLGVKSRRAKGR